LEVALLTYYTDASKSARIEVRRRRVVGARSTAEIALSDKLGPILCRGMFICLKKEDMRILYR